MYTHPIVTILSEHSKLVLPILFPLSQEGFVSLLYSFNKLYAQVLVRAGPCSTKMLTQAPLAPPDLLLMVTVPSSKVSLRLSNILTRTPPARCQVYHKR